MNLQRCRSIVILGCLVGAAFAPAQTMVHAHPRLNVGILKNAKVRQELKVDASTVSALDKAIEELGVGLKLQINGNSPAEVEEQVQEQVNESDQRAAQRLKDVLSESQLVRFRQLSLQEQGVGAFSIHAVSRELSLTAAQQTLIEAEQTKINDYLATVSTQTSNNNGDVRVVLAPTPAEQRTLHEKSKQAVEAVVATFSPEQKKTWSDLTGPAFDFDAP